MAKVLLNDQGKVLLRNGKVATSDSTNCCCGSGTGACCQEASCSILSADDCSNVGGIYQGDNTTCDPNPCKVGACCLDEGQNCEIHSAHACSTLGGFYFGDDTVCDPSPCFIMALTCDAISSTYSKCGVEEYVPSDPPRFYLTQVTHNTRFQTVHVDPGVIGLPPCGEDSSLSGDYLLTETYDTGCGYGSTEDCSNEGHVHGYGGDDCFDPDCDEGWDCTTEYGTGCYLSFGHTYQEGPCSNEVSATSDITTCSYTSSDPSPSAHVTSITVNSMTLADEFTTAALIAIVEAAMPAYDDFFGDACEAIRSLSEDESSYTISRFIPRFILDVSAPAAFTLTYNEHFVPEDEDEDPVDTPRILHFIIGDDFKDGPEVLEPEENGTITITDVAVELL